MPQQDETLDRVWDLIEKIGVCMLTTQSARGLRARPMEARTDREAGLIFFVTDLRGSKDDEIATEHDIGLVFIGAGDKAYLSITARAEVMRDSAKARAVWKKSDGVWWPGGPDDPHVRVLRVTPSLAELWDGPASSVVAAYEMTKARLTGEKPDLGENRKVTVTM